MHDRQSMLAAAQRILAEPEPQARLAVDLQEWTEKRIRDLPEELRREHLQSELLLLQRRFFTLLRRATLAQRQPLVQAYLVCYTQWEDLLADVDLPAPYLVVKAPVVSTEPDDPGVMLAEAGEEA